MSGAGFALAAEAITRAEGTAPHLAAYDLPGNVAVAEMPRSGQFGGIARVLAVVTRTEDWKAEPCPR